MHGRQRRLTLLAALLLSLAAHVLFVAGGEIGLPDLYSPPDEVLASKAPGQIQRVQLMAAKAPARSPKRAPPPKQTAVVRPLLHEEIAEATPTTPEETPPTAPDNPAPAPEAAPAQNVTPEPAPAFPVQIHAVLEAHYNGFPFTIQQTWLMEGLHYSINLTASRFGFHFRLSSEGSVNPQGGLLPEHYRLLLNEKVRTFADYENGELRYGRQDSPRNGKLVTAPQDMASLPFHVAVTFNGEPQSLIVTTGNGVYEVRLVAEAEETLKLPAGTLRTLHLRGERYDVERGRMQTGYEVWLALDYLNYPVRFTGLAGNGDKLEYRVRQLEIEGRRVLDDGAGEDVVPPDEAIPEWIRRQTPP